MFEQMTLARKVRRSFVVLGAISYLVVVVGAFSLLRLHRQNFELYTAQIKSLASLAMISDAFQRSRVELRDAVLRMDDAGKLPGQLPKVSELHQTVSVNLDKLATTVSTPEMRALTVLLVRQQDAYFASIATLGVVAKPGKRDAMRVLVDGDAEVSARQVRETIATLVTVSEAQAKRHMVSSCYTLWLTVALFLVAMVGTWYFIRYMGYSLTANIDRLVAERLQSAQQYTALVARQQIRVLPTEFRRR